MKNLLKKLPVIAFILSIGTAFAFTSYNEVNQVFYRNSSGVFLEKTSAGECVQGTWNCEYIYIGSGTPGMDQDPDSYQATGLENRIFVPE